MEDFEPSMFISAITLAPGIPELMSKQTNPKIYEGRGTFSKEHTGTVLLMYESALTGVKKEKVSKILTEEGQLGAHERFGSFVGCIAFEEKEYSKEDAIEGNGKYTWDYPSHYKILKIIPFRNVIPYDGLKQPQPGFWYPSAVVLDDCLAEMRNTLRHPWNAPDSWFKDIDINGQLDDVVDTTQLNALDDAFIAGFMACLTKSHIPTRRVRQKIKIKASSLGLPVYLGGDECDSHPVVDIHVDSVHCSEDDIKDQLVVDCVVDGGVEDDDQLAVDCVVDVEVEDDINDQLTVDCVVDVDVEDGEIEDGEIEDDDECGDSSSYSEEYISTSAVPTRKRKRRGKKERASLKRQKLNKN